MNRRLNLCALLGLLLTVGCDPNVVIGAKWGDSSSAGTSPAAAGTDPGPPPSGGGGSGELGGSGGDAIGGGAAGEVPGGAAGAGTVEPGVLFTADHEDGSGLEQWNEGPDADAGGYYADETLPVYTTEQAHSGVGSAKLTIDTSDGTNKIARLYRRISGSEAFYSAWFYLNEDHTPGDWWSIFLFRAVQERADSIDLWSVDLVREGEDQLTLSVFRHATSDVIAVPSKPIVPVQQWFQLEAYLYAVAGEPSQLTLWLDGQEVLKLEDDTPAPAGEPLYWVIGNGGSPLTPALCTVYVDDALVSETRRGP